MKFIKATVIIWLLLFFGLAYIPHAKAQKQLQRFKYSQKHMGTLFRIVLYHTDSITANKAAKAGFARVAKLDHILSDYQKDSELNKLSQSSGTNTWVKVSPEMWYILNKSVQISQKTKGAFDITIGPYVQLWRRARRQNQIPSSDILAQAKVAVGYQNIAFDSKTRSVKLLKTGMQLDMGAIGKGYAIDEALKVVKQYNIKRALVDGGGNIVVSKVPPKTKGWEITLEPYTPQDNPTKIIKF